MNWLRTKLRAWLGIKDGISADEFIAYQEGQQQILTALQSQLNDINKSLNGAYDACMRLSAGADNLRKGQIAQQGQIAQITTQLTDFKAALKAKASERRVPRPYDYESAQVAALTEFEEKPNGVR